MSIRLYSVLECKMKKQQRQIWRVHKWMLTKRYERHAEQNQNQMPSKVNISAMILARLYRKLYHKIKPVNYNLKRMPVMEVRNPVH